jgi:tetratricopeptide (TPR) repeat protein
MRDRRASRLSVFLLWAMSSTALGRVAPAQDTSHTQSAVPRVAPSSSNDTGAVVSSHSPETPATYIAAGDRERTAMQPNAALADYEQAIALDSSDYQALYKASREAVDLGEFEPDAKVKQQDFDTGLRLARRAVAADSTGPDGHFAVARALGREALAVGGKKRIEFAKEVRSEALKALSYDPHHAGALHIMGVWNAEVMRLSGIERFIARNLLGGGILGTANWKDAIQYLEQAVAIEPNRIVHHLDLGKVYADVGDKAKAREQLEAVLALPSAEYNDPHYKQDAESRLAHL